MSTSICPHLGLSGDRTLLRSGPDERHRCYAQTPPGEPELKHQEWFCFSSDHVRCQFYVAPTEPVADAEVAEPGRALGRMVYLIAIVAAVAIIATVYGRSLLSAPVPSGPAPELPATVLVDDSPTPEPTPTLIETATLSAEPTRFTTPTPEEGGRILSLKPSAADVGWWANGETRGHLGDSFLYGGSFEGQTFISAFNLDLSRIPRGTPLRSATLRLTGLDDERLMSEAGGAWSVEILAPDDIAELGKADFQSLFNAPVAATLLPALSGVDLAANKANLWTLDPSTLAWLQQQVLDGVSAVTIRISGPSSDVETLFSWDSGAGPSSLGEAPELVLALGPSPATPPPLPTEAFIVATLTPTPENVLTVAAQLLTATASTTTGTPVASAIIVVATPTPTPENQATTEAIIRFEGLPPLVIDTPTPENLATATANALLATAIALTTGTFTPIPINAITPVIITPTPQPENAATAAVMAFTATAQAQSAGTAPPLPYNILVATVTPRPILITPTSRPSNAATATEIAAQATVIALTTGTYTPIPTYAVTPTTTPRPTAIPLLIYNFPTVAPTPTSPARNIPNSLRGKILFFSNRPMPVMGDKTGLWALDPTDGSLAYVTQTWPYELGQSQELLRQAPQGQLSLSVQPNPQRVLQVYLTDHAYGALIDLSQSQGMSYDAAFSPDGSRVAYVSTEPGNDEVYVVDRDGSNRQRLTFNNWEWDKHPSWSPDGNQIVFHSNRDTGRRQIWVMNADGGGQRRLLESPYDDYAPVWLK
ncbi:MAG: PD40 domain-containing protein [Caldilineales bacterium]|nr:PD40 domain-containing protein [Caldilineales bacterium]